MSSLNLGWLLQLIVACNYYLVLKIFVILELLVGLLISAESWKKCENLCSSLLRVSSFAPVNLFRDASYLLFILKA